MPLLKIGESIIKSFDQGWLENCGGQSLIEQLRVKSTLVDYFFSLDVKSYLLGFFFILVFLFICVYLNSLRVRA